MSKGYGMIFVKDNKYRGGWAFTSHTTRSKIAQIKAKEPYLFEGDWYETYSQDYDAIEITVSEENFNQLKMLMIEYMNDVWYSFFEELALAMKMCLFEGFKIFLA